MQRQLTYSYNLRMLKYMLYKYQLMVLQASYETEFICQLPLRVQDSVITQKLFILSYLLFFLL